MSEIRPFRGIIYNQRKIRDLRKVTTPPFDVISPYQQEFYYRSHPYNIIRVALGREYSGDNVRENKYTRAGRFFRGWLSSGILKKEKEAAFYVYGQKYSLKGKGRERRGLVALMKLEKFGLRVFPHEKTFAQVRADRLRLLRSCRANLNPIFSLYVDPQFLIDKYLKERELLFRLKDEEGVEHELGVIRDEKIMEEIVRIMEDKKIFIADGHHRYLTALKFSQEEKKKFSSREGIRGEDLVMVYFLNMETDAVTILPVHRVIGGLTLEEISRLKLRIRDFFQVEVLKFASKIEERVKRRTVLRRLQEEGQEDPIFGMYCGEDRYYLLSLKEDRSSLEETINTVILHKLIIGKILGKRKLEKGKEIDFVKDEEEAIELIKGGNYQVAFFLKALSPKQIREISLSGKEVPHKSSYFYPKLLTGLIMRDLEDQIS